MKTIKVISLFFLAAVFGLCAQQTNDLKVVRQHNNPNNNFTYTVYSYQPAGGHKTGRLNLYFVWPSVPVGTNDGTSWNHAFPSLANLPPLKYGDQVNLRTP